MHMRAVPPIVGACCIIAAGIAATHAQSTEDPYASFPSRITVSGTVRDFKDRNSQGGHPDFQRQPSSGFGHYVGMVANVLDSEGLPVFASTGYKVSSQWRDASGKNIIPPKPYIESRQGDVNGAASSSPGGALTNATNFSQWFRDVPGLNAAKALKLTLVRQPNTRLYVFDDRLDPTYSAAGGFFPINGQLYGDYGTTGKNYHFTYMLHADFKYERGTDQTFTFIGDDDVWVFVDGKLVIDIGGVHEKVQQSINLDRLGWLEDGELYTLSFFFAERHTTQSNFRIETTIFLRTITPMSSPLFD